MRLFEFTRRHLWIAAIALPPIALAQVFEEQAASALGIAPKFVGLIGCAVGGAGACVYWYLTGPKTPKHKWPVPLWQRLVALTMLVMGAAYFFMREEIADLLKWRIGFGDALFLLACLVTLMLLFRYLPPVPTERESEDHDRTTPPSEQR
jgi:hypothetical protein